MPRIKGFDLFAIGVVTAAGIYMGTQFFEPIIIDQLRKDGHLRTDITIPEYDSEGNPADAKSMMQLREDLIKLQEQEKVEASNPAIPAIPTDKPSNV